MTVLEAYTLLEQKQPRFVYVAGKSCTGKSTFSQHAATNLGYSVVQLDDVVWGGVMQPLKLTDRGNIFIEVYLKRDRLDWINRFVEAAQKVIRSQAKESPIIIEGAVAVPETLEGLLRPFADVRILYFHPQNIHAYQSQLTSRFMQATENGYVRLPNDFWAQISQQDFRQFCKDRIVTPQLQKGIHRYALHSQKESASRLNSLQAAFADLQVVSL